MAEQNYCKWCKYNNHRCSKAASRTCDFANLKFEKKAILERLKSELNTVNSTQKRIDRNMKVSDSAVQDAFDKVHGILVMIKVLKEEFGLTDKEIKKALGTKTTLSMLTKAKMLYHFMSMKGEQK